MDSQSALIFEEVTGGNRLHLSCLSVGWGKKKSYSYSAFGSKVTSKLKYKLGHELVAQ